MMVIQGTLAADVEGITAGTYVFPADRCFWQQIDSADGDGYAITEAHMILGNNAEIELTSARLGLIGKSGRFVPITDAS